ncbi:TRAP transporter small permease [Azospirillum sp. ST 5-10]|uniref:TRAP transporter small permease n=1 Tax=unclassified Azospirillum TaxID=2630922 RepID=UPI003F49FC09
MSVVSDQLPFRQGAAGGDGPPAGVPDADLEPRFVEDSEFDARSFAVEDYVAFVFFWFMALVVFAQFFSRYALNDSIIWTEEVARYLLIAVTFFGAAMAARRNSHIAIELTYRLLPVPIARILSALVDVLRTLFYGTFCWLGVAVYERMQGKRLVSLDVPLDMVYGLIVVAFALMTLRSAAVAWRNWRDDTSPLIAEARR